MHKVIKTKLGNEALVFLTSINGEPVIRIQSPTEIASPMDIRFSIENFDDDTYEIEQAFIDSISEDFIDGYFDLIF